MATQQPRPQGWGRRSTLTTQCPLMLIAHMLKLTMSKRDVHPMRSWQKWVKWWCGMSKTQVSWDQSGHQKLWHHHHNPTANDRPQNIYKITYRINLNKLQNSSSQVLFKPASAQSRASPAVNVSPTHTQVSLYHVQIYPNQMSLYSSHIRPLQKEGGPTPWTGITIEFPTYSFSCTTTSCPWNEIPGRVPATVVWQSERR